METDPADQPTIAQLLDDYDIVEYIGAQRHADLLAALEARDWILRDDAAEYALKNRRAS